MNLGAIPSRSAQLSRKLREEIEHGTYPVGERFPTDADIAHSYKVSRTVVREAVAGLRELGLIKTTQGRGSMVIADKAPISINVAKHEMALVDNVIRIYEVRTALEVETAALAAERRTQEDLDRISKALDRIDAMIARSEDAIEADLDFHIAIAHASQNEYFARIIESLRQLASDRKHVRAELNIPRLLQQNTIAIQNEHRKIEAAIIEQDARLARRLMRQHLSARRYREILESAEY